jgi:precorrin-3B synthase
MPTGDGLLVRLIPAAPIPLDAMAGFCEAARRHGNGTIEISARGSLQVRGLTPQSAHLFAAAVAHLGIAVQHGVPVIAGIGDGAAELLAADLRRAIADARLALSHKVSVVVDGGGPLHLDGLSADVRLRVVGSDQGPRSPVPRFHLGIGGDRLSKRTAPPLPLPREEEEDRGEGRVPGVLSLPSAPHLVERERPAASGNGVKTTWLGTVLRSDAVGAVTRVLAIIAAQGPGARASDILGRDGVEAFLAVPAVDPVSEPPPRAPAEMIGCHAMRDGTAACGIGLAFGHTHADPLAELIRFAAHRGAQALRPIPDRTLLLTGISAPDAQDLTTAAERLGFVVQYDDPRRRIAACPGAPACASGLISARLLASTLAPVLASILKRERSDAVVHISGCPKGCAHPAPAALTLVGASQGCGVVQHGSACTEPNHYVDPARLGEVIAHFMEVAHG